MMNIRPFTYIFIFVVVNQIYFFKAEVEVSSDAAAAIKQQSDGRKQTFISSQSKAKSGKESPYESHADAEIGQRSSNTDPSSGQPCTDCQIWGYTDNANTYGPENWGKYYPQCNGKNQSPIALLADSAKASGKMVTPLRMLNMSKDAMLFGYFANNGHSFGVEINENKTNLLVSGGPLNDDTYKLNQFHFHFSCSNKETGSEHSLEGLKYVGELHFVFYNTKYGSFGNAVEKSDGLTVLGFFIKSTDDINQGTFLLNRNLVDIINPGSTINLPLGISLFDLVKSLRDGPENLKYVYYQGSLTTPPCYESVTWIVFYDGIRIPLRDIESWRRLNGNNHERLCNNFRPLQQINTRSVLYVNPAAAPKNA